MTNSNIFKATVKECIQFLVRLILIIVRNNIYRLSVNKIAGLGSGEPFIDPDQPDEYKAELDINFNVFPWAVRNQDVELE